MKHSTKLVIDNHQLEQAGYTAYIHHSIVTLDAEGVFDEDIWATIETKEEHQDLLGIQYMKIEERFTDMLRAMDWIKQKSEEIVIEGLKMRAWRGRDAQRQLDDIDTNGFKL